VSEYAWYFPTTGSRRETTLKKGEDFMQVQEMIRTSPGPAPADPDTLSRCIEACYECAQTCSACSDACLGEQAVQDLTSCIALNEVCADVCATTGAALSRIVQAGGLPIRKLLESCAEACRTCAEECERHAGHMEHCKVCAEACRRCEAACHDLLGAVA
jgi:hypothetical protein